MARNLFTRYIWLVDVIRRYKRITREGINEAWAKSNLGQGETCFTRRTFYNYRQAIQELFDVNIEFDSSTYEYYIADEDETKESATNWLLNSAATNELITTSRDLSDRIFLEDVPSARDHLSVLIDALRASTAVKFDYHPYTRSLPTTGVEVEPYFVKIFKQRWYLVGRNVKEDKVKTYALDRMGKVTQLADKFELPSDFNAKDYFRDAFGIVVDSREPKGIILRVEPTQAKYFRALPLHHSQKEMVDDKGSIFLYKMRVTQDLVSELLSYGPKVTVLQPKELRAMVVDALKKSLEQYGKD